MNTKFLRWALPAFALTVAGAHPVEAGIPGKTSYGARLGFQNMSLNGKGITGGTTVAGVPYTNPIQAYGSNYGAAAGDLFISHDVNFSRDLCFGVEGYVGGSNMDTGRINHDFGDGFSVARTNVRKDYTVGGRVKLGHYVQNNVLLYASLGVESTRFKIDHNYEFNAGGLGATTSRGYTGSHNLWA